MTYPTKIKSNYSVSGIDILVMNVPEASLDALLRTLHSELSVVKLGNGASLLFDDEEFAMIGVMFEHDLDISDPDDRTALLQVLEGQAEKAVLSFNQQHGTHVVILEVNFVT